MNKRIVIVIFICFLLINVSYAEAFSFQDVLDAVNNFFDKIFGREKVGVPIPEPDNPCECNENNDCPIGYQCQTGGCQSYGVNTGSCVPLNPNIVVSPISLDFGETVAGQTPQIVTRSLTVLNNGNEPLSVTNIYIPDSDVITASPTSFTVQPSQSQNVIFTFAPEFPGEYDNILEIVSNDPDTPLVSVNYIGIGLSPEGPPPPPPSYLECNDQIDNDGDGKCDKFGCIINGQELEADPGCYNIVDDDESNCGDNVCEGGETKVGCPADCCVAQGLPQYGLYKQCASLSGCVNNQNDQACCNEQNDCVYNGQCYENIYGTTSLCSDSSCISVGDYSNDKEVCLHITGSGGSGGGSLSWYDADTLQTACDKAGGHWMTKTSNSGKCQQYQRWVSNAPCNDANPSSNNYCCGDDINEYYTESNGKTACCGISGLTINSAGNCVSGIEICNNGIDDDGNGEVDCYDTVGCPVSQDLGGYICDTSKKLHETNFTDNIDNDNDNVKDKLDSDCKIQSYNPSNYNTPNYCNSLSISNVVVQGNKKEFYVYSEIPYINCNYNKLSEGDSNSIIECIDMNVSNIPCSNKQYYSNYIKFIDCYVGETLGDANINCYVDDKCNSQIPNSYLYGINVTEFEICNSNSNNKGDIGIGNFSIFETSGILDAYNLNNKIDIDIEVGNQQDNGQSIEVKTEAWLVQINNGLKKASAESDYEEIEHLESKMFELNLTIPTDLSLNQTYRLYVKAFKKNNENKMCISDNYALNLLEEECVDEDEDGYCSNNDCDDNDENINPSIFEVCDDDVDNDCDGFTDFADDDCQPLEGECTPSWNCSPWQPLNEDCNIGETQTRTCVDGSQCGINLTKPTETQNCGQGYGDVDSDNDGLPDEWELAYFGNLAQGPNDDPDGDGMTNAQEYASNTNPKVSDKLREGGGLLTVLIIAGIVVVIGVIAVLLYFKFIRKIEKGKTFISNEDKLVDYIRKCRQKGLSDDNIKEELLKVGWKKEDFSKYLK